MATGAKRETTYNKVRYMYKANGTAKPTAPADITAFNAAWTAGEEIKVRGDLDLPLDQSGETPANITWRESGEEGEQFVADITPAPGQAVQLELVISGYFDSAVIQTIMASPLNTYGTLYLDIESVSGTAARTAGTGNTSPQGTAAAVIIRHGKPALNVRTSDVQHLTLSASWDSTTVYNYGPA